MNFCRAFFAFFTDFEHEGITGDWHRVGEMLWGYPEMLDYEPPHIHNRLAEVELAFGTVEELEADWAHFRKGAIAYLLTLSAMTFSVTVDGGIKVNNPHQI